MTTTEIYCKFIKAYYNKEWSIAKDYGNQLIKAVANGNSWPWGNDWMEQEAFEVNYQAACNYLEREEDDRYLEEMYRSF